MCASFRDHLSYPGSENQSMKVIVLLIVVITICSCSTKVKVSCNVNDIDTVINDCKEQPQFGITKEF